MGSASSNLHNPPRHGLRRPWAKSPCSCWLVPVVCGFASRREPAHTVRPLGQLTAAVGLVLTCNKKFFFQLSSRDTERVCGGRGGRDRVSASRPAHSSSGAGSNL